jgi:hypothetical protein
LIFCSNQQNLYHCVNVQRVFIDNFNEGIKHFYRYELTGDIQRNWNKAASHLNKAIGIAYTFVTIDSLIGEMPQERMENHLYSHFSEGVNYDKRKVILLGNMMKMLSVT